MDVGEAFVGEDGGKICKNKEDEVSEGRKSERKATRLDSRAYPGRAKRAEGFILRCGFESATEGKKETSCLW